MEYTNTRQMCEQVGEEGRKVKMRGWGRGKEERIGIYLVLLIHLPSTVDCIAHDV